MRSARAYAVVAVVLVTGALLGAVSFAWGDPGAKSTRSVAVNPEPFPAGGGGGKQTPQGKQTPLLMRVLDAPEPVKGSDGKYHLVYELVLANSSPGTATVEWVKTIDEKSGEVVGNIAGADVTSRMVRLGDVSGATIDKIESGQVALLFMDVTFDDPRDVPREVEHRLRARFDIPSAFGSNLFPAVTTDTGGGTEVLRKKPVVISPPLKGKNWVASNGCCTVSQHRGAMIGIDQKLLATERYAIDWIQTDAEGHVVLSSDTTKLTDFPAYGDPLLAVANGKVVDVVKGFPDVKPGVLDQDLTFKEAGGNHVILDIGGGRYAFYAHLKPGSIEVKEGDYVRSGQRIARLGNSGNTTAPHLHFHVMDAPLPLGAEHNLPYVFDSFTYQGRFEDDGTPDLLDTPEPREDELPLYNSLVTFPAP
jgi:Peptidase family M23